MIGRRITPRLGDDPKIRWAIGTPEASVFFDPQNAAAVRSPAGKPSPRPRAPTPTSITASRRAEPISVAAITSDPCSVQTPCRTESQNDV